ncbi:MAG TPA: 4'-phosphopantetheinyl transferase superfamily protein [Bdellovibrionota bacterium]|nr:4'-phosphopantetheinyl transferase superfamily protein [Bdellovibrionota bacterium]
MLKKDWESLNSALTSSIGPLQLGTWSVAARNLDDSAREELSETAKTALVALRGQLNGAPNPRQNSREQQPPPAHTRRMRERLAGDLCLLDLWRALSKDAPELSISELQLSLTHSKDLAVALGRVARDGQREEGIGIDLELRNRKLIPNLLERITEHEERRFGLHALQIWTIKEACFKANRFNSGSAVTEHRIRDFNPGTNSGKAVIGKLHFDFALTIWNDWYLTVARMNAPKHGLFLAP